MSSTPAQKFTALPQVFDASGITPQQPMEAVPAGWYNAAITDGEVKPTNDGAGIRMELTWTILDGPFKGRKVFDGLNIQNASAKAQEIAQQQLSAICHAIATIRFQDVQELFNKPHQIKVDQEAGRYVGADGDTLDLPAGSPVPMGAKFYDTKNRFKGAKAGTGAVAPAAAAASAAPAIPAPVAAPAGNPWGKTPAAAPATPATPAAAPAAPAKAAGPKAPSKPKPAAAAPAPARKFHVLMPDGEVSDPKPEAEIVAMLAQGMPLETMINPEGGGDEDWKPAGEFKLGAAAPVAAPAAATPAGAPVAPPWANRSA